EAKKKHRADGVGKDRQRAAVEEEFSALDVPGKMREHVAVAILGNRSRRQRQKMPIEGNAKIENNLLDDRRLHDLDRIVQGELTANQHHVDADEPGQQLKAAFDQHLID